jgi:hypothetical protein
MQPKFATYKWLFSLKLRNGSKMIRFASLEPYKRRDGNELSPSSLPLQLLSNSTQLKIKVRK